jgi:5-formyltetrahydrofolate cyclo-ligase
MKSKLRNQIKKKLLKDNVKPNDKIKEIYNSLNVVAIYKSLPEEMNTEEIIQDLIKQNKTILLSVMDKNEIKFVEYTNECKKNCYNIEEPINGKKYNGKIDAIIVPGLAFDLNKNRLGRGKGCYDKYLKNYNGIKIGLCKEMQIIDEVPVEEHDVKMDYIVTEKRVIK